MGHNFSGPVRSDRWTVAFLDVPIGVTARLTSCYPCSPHAEFREIRDTPELAGCGAAKPAAGWITSMGRKAKGDRHTIIPSMPSEAAALVKAESTKLGCYTGDYIAWIVSGYVGVLVEVPIGDVTDHPDPLPAPFGRVKYRTMVPRAAADRVIDAAEQRGTTLGDFVAAAVCGHFDVPFEPRVMKKALKAWAKAAEAGEQLPMTG